MALISTSVPSLIGGVSQQPASIRLPNQCETQENAMASVLKGLTKRPPTEHVAELQDSSAILPAAYDSVFNHVINRSDDEQYIVSILSDHDAGGNKGTLLIHNVATGVKSTVTATSAALDYLNETNADSTFKAVTVADLTYILNTNKTTAMNVTGTSASAVSTPGDTNAHEALVFIKQGIYGTTYTIRLDSDGGTDDSQDYAVGDGTSPTDSSAATYDATNLPDRINTTSIATAMVAGLNGGSFTVSSSGPVVWIRSATAFTVDVEDGKGNTLIGIIDDAVQRFTDLPTVAPEGYIVKVEGNPEDEVDDYYAKFTANDGTFGEGIWQECAAPGIEDQLNASTMPHVLVNTGTNTFTFAKADGSAFTNYSWNKRVAGDATSNADPSFVGKKINGLSFYKSRLAFLADENIILSETSQFFNFFRTTTIDLLDTDRIDVATSHREISILRHAVPFNDSLILFSDHSQFVFKGSEGIISPRTASMTPVTDFDSFKTVKPVASGNSVFFGFDRGTFSGVREFVPLGDSVNSYFANDITIGIPQYISGDIINITASTHENIVIALSKGDQSSLYMYQYYQTNRERLQSAWGKLTFTGATILNAEFINTTLFLVVQRTDGLYLEKIRFESGRVDAGSSYVTSLDRRVDQATSGLSRSYSAATNRTTITLPYDISSGATMKVVSKAGSVHNITSQTTNTVLVVGDLTSTDFWVGEEYTMTYEFSEFTLKEQRNQGFSLVSTGRLQIRYLTLRYDDTGFFKVVITPDFQTAFEYDFSGRILGQGDNILGQEVISDGTFRVPVFSKADRVKIEIKNATHVPSNIMAAEFESNYSTRSMRR
tara:strand:- start:3020 stop:5509 length:2490 start_codon:yes stop_codon:yes gene_type:complete